VYFTRFVIDFFYLPGKNGNFDFMNCHISLGRPAIYAVGARSGSMQQASFQAWDFCERGS